MSSNGKPFERLRRCVRRRAYGSLRDRIDGGKGLRRGRPLCRAGARIFYRTRGGAQSRVALPVVARPLSAFGGEARSDCISGSRKIGTERQRAGTGTLPAE